MHAFFNQYLPSFSMNFILHTLLKKLFILMLLAGWAEQILGQDTVSKQSKTASAPVYSEIDWTDMLPDSDLAALENPPEYLYEIQDGSENDQLSSQLKAESPSNFLNNSGDTSVDTSNPNISPAEQRYQQALVSTQIRPEFDGRHIRIPGFIVPLEFDDHQTITTFFLVPFFGACLHLPPPPPNQIIYAEYEPGFQLDSLYEPFWINGTVSTTLIENDLATAAYSMDVAKIEPYTHFVDEGEQ